MWEGRKENFQHWSCRVKGWGLFGDVGVIQEVWGPAQPPRCSKGLEWRLEVGEHAGQQLAPEGLTRPGRNRGKGVVGPGTCQGGAVLTSVPPALPSFGPAGVSTAPGLSEVFALDGWISQPAEVWNVKQNEQNARNMLLRATKRNKIWRPRILVLAPAARMLLPHTEAGKQQGARAGQAVRANLGGHCGRWQQHFLAIFEEGLRFLPSASMLKASETQNSWDPFLPGRAHGD